MLCLVVPMAVQVWCCSCSSACSVCPFRCTAELLTHLTAPLLFLYVRAGSHNTVRFTAKKAGGDADSADKMLDPEGIRYTHSRIRPVFSGCGRTIEQASFLLCTLSLASPRAALALALAQKGFISLC